MRIESVYQLMKDIKIWVSKRSHGGFRKGAGAPKRTKEIKQISLSAEKEDIQKAKEYAKSKGVSLQSLFREWLQILPSNH